MKMDGVVFRLLGLSVNDISHGRYLCPGGTPHCPHQGSQRHRQQQTVTVTSAAQISGQCLQTSARSQLTLIGDGTKERDVEEKVSERTCSHLINKNSLLLPEEANRKPAPCSETKAPWNLKQHSGEQTSSTSHIILFSCLTCSSSPSHHII